MGGWQSRSASHAVSHSLALLFSLTPVGPQRFQHDKKPSTLQVRHIRNTGFLKKTEVA